MSKKVNAVIIGLLIVAIGVCYGLKAFGILPGFTIFIKGWWTAFIILPGLFMLF